MINEAFEEIDKATGVQKAMPVLGVSGPMLSKHLVALFDVNLAYCWKSW